MIDKKYFQDILDDIKQSGLWKEERNRLIHALMKQALTTEELQNLAEQGQVLVKKLCSITTSYSRKINKLNQK